jgi:hypothetical protein
MGLYLSIERLNALGKKNSVTGKYWSIADIYSKRFNRTELMVGTNALVDLPVVFMGQNAFSTGVLIDIEHVWRAVQEMEKPPVLVLLDYAQKLEPVERGKGNSLWDSVSVVMKECDQFCVQTGLPAWVSTQSNARVSDYKVPIPNEKDISDGSSFAHRFADTTIALMRPANHIQFKQDEMGNKPLVIDTGMGKYPNVPDLQVVRKLKERGAEFGVAETAFRFNPGTMQISELPEYSTETLDFNDAVNYSDEELAQWNQQDWIPT